MNSLASEPVQTTVSANMNVALTILAVAWAFVALAPILLAWSVSKGKADSDACLTALGLIWCGPITIVLVGMIANWGKMMLDVSKSLNGK